MTRGGKSWKGGQKLNPIAAEQERKKEANKCIEQLLLEKNEEKRKNIFTEVFNKFGEDCLKELLQEKRLISIDMYS